MFHMTGPRGKVLSLNGLISPVVFQGHINNLYNTCFWNLVKVSGLSAEDAEKQLCVSSA